MRRSIGSPNRSEPFKTALELANRERPHCLRLIANRLLDAAEQGDLPSAREVGDRLGGKAVQMIDVTSLWSPSFPMPSLL
jgi:hypothetical protein